ncbi:hypothetical protein Pcinc_015093 [Petrolisthes cinctipes]|uniref:Putative nuclease HARBI1 n=1 Tax=Petrolisthes cinctipes TaxID=88211 RepID=A0AAE1FU38_PETCI|nr:hypothetical protein Pcinc_015093 [Petrolisthes cinctipes]
MAEQQQQRAFRIRRPRNFRPRLDIFGEYSDTELKKRYRLDRNGLMYVTNLVRDEIGNRTQRSHAVTADMKVAMTLRYLSTGKMQLCNGDDFGLSQPTISRAITQTLDALTAELILSRFIQFPVNLEEIRDIQGEFLRIAGFPGVVSVVDGTHVRIVAPKEYEEVYVNRKNFHSINVQVVFDAKYQIRDIVARWPGSTHDSRILRESGLWQAFENHQLPIPAGCHLLGDSGYPCKRWLLTTYLRPQEGYQEAFNRAHKKTRCVVERGIGLLKRRFHVLHGEIRLAPEKAAKVIMACGILHNICKRLNIQLEEEEEEDVDDPNGLDVFQPAPNAGAQEGVLFRDDLARNIFMIED